jgi:hypothetical protein
LQNIILQRVIQYLRFQVSARPLNAEVTSLIREKTFLEPEKIVKIFCGIPTAEDELDLSNHSIVAGSHSHPPLTSAEK